jgi:hypothetical protein
LEDDGRNVMHTKFDRTRRVVIVRFIFGNEFFNHGAGGPMHTAEIVFSQFLDGGWVVAETHRCVQICLEGWKFKIEKLSHRQCFTRKVGSNESAWDISV